MQRTFLLKRTTEFRSPIFHSEVLTFTGFHPSSPLPFLLFSNCSLTLSYFTNGYESHYLSHPEKKEKKHTQKKKLSAILSVIVHFQNSQMVAKVTVFPTVNSKRKKKEKEKITTLLEASGIELTAENHYSSTISTEPLCLRILVSML